MKTFDEILPAIKSLFQKKPELLAKIKKLIINRDLNGRIRLLAENNLPDDAQAALTALGEDITDVLGGRVAGFEKIMYEPSLDAFIKDAPCFKLGDLPDTIEVLVVDRLLSDAIWEKIKPIKPNSRRVVFYSIKGGVGRSTALAATAWALAEEGKRVLVMDMDLESPGISSSLRSPEKAPKYGIVDWLVEDLLDNGDEALSSIFSASDLSRNGEVFVVPAYGKKPGEYISKIGRVWMSKHTRDNGRELWHSRLERLIQNLENKHNPDVVLIDSRAGIDEISSACITSLGAESVLLFAIDSDQTWNGYEILFEHWRNTGVAKDIRERLQIIGALIPDHDRSQEYIDSLREHSWDLFTNQLYDIIPSNNTDTDFFNFDRDDVEAPHYPRLVRWNRGFEASENLYQPLGQRTMQDQVSVIFGGLIDFVKGICQ